MSNQQTGQNLNNNDFPSLNPLLNAQQQVQSEPKTMKVQEDFPALGGNDFPSLGAPQVQEIQTQVQQPPQQSQQVPNSWEQLIPQDPSIQKPANAKKERKKLNPTATAFTAQPVQQEIQFGFQINNNFMDPTVAQNQMMFGGPFQPFVDPSLIPNNFGMPQMEGQLPIDPLQAQQMPMNFDPQQYDFMNMNMMDPNMFMMQPPLIGYDEFGNPIFADQVYDDSLGGFVSFRYGEEFEDEQYEQYDFKTGKDRKKKPKEKVKKTNVPPKIIRYKRLEKEKTEEQKTQEIMGMGNQFKKQEKFTVDLLRKYELENFDKQSKQDEKLIKYDSRRECINVVFIGHVDAGKSTLAGRVLIDTGEVADDEVRKYEQEAIEKHREGWYLAYVMDINEEEKAKGKTVEYGRAHFQLNKKRFTLIDAPGHKNYVPNMIMGASQADIAILIISAKQGEFESGFEKGGQTQEHVHLAKALGVSQLIVAVTKMDTCKWDQGRYKLIKDQVQPWIEKNTGMKNVIWVPIDGFGDVNIKDRVQSNICSWYNDRCFFEILDDVEVPKRNPTGPIRIPIQDRMKDNFVYTFGKIESGCIREDMWACLLPLRKPFQIQHLYNSKDQRIMYALPGENIKIKVKGLEEDDLQRGHMICDIDNHCHVTQEFYAFVDILELPEHKQILSQGYSCVMHIHASVHEIEIQSIEAYTDPVTKKHLRTSFLKSGMSGVVKIYCKKYICLEKFEQMEHLGRFTLRDEGITIASGKVYKLKPAFKYKQMINLLMQKKKLDEENKQKSEQQTVISQQKDLMDNSNATVKKSE